MYPLIKDVGTSTDFSYIVDEIIFVSLKPILTKRMDSMFLQPVVDSYVTSEVSVKIVIGGMMVFDNAISIESVVFGAVI